MREYKENQKVKYIRVETRHAGEPEWDYGIYKQQNTDKSNQTTIEVTTSTGKVIHLPAYAVYPLECIEEEEITEFGKQNVNDLFELVQKAVNKLLANQGINVKMDGQEPIVSLGHIEISPTTLELHSIIGFKQIPGWSVTIFDSVPGSHWEPPDVSEACVGTAITNIEAAKLAIQTMFECLAATFWENEILSAMDKNSDPNIY